MALGEGGYVLHCTRAESDLYTVRDLVGFFGSEGEAAAFRAVGAGRVAEPPVAAGHEELEVRVLGPFGRPVAAYTVGDAHLAEEQRADGSLDVRVTGYLLDPPRRGTGEIWSLWRRRSGQGRRNAWAGLREDGREAWLDAARLRAVWRHPRPPTATAPAQPPHAATFVLDGRHTTDHAGLFCALGEALNGPGGYYGACTDALRDCLRGGFGPAAPFTLTWRHAGTARAHVPRAGADVLRVLRSAGVAVRPTGPPPTALHHLWDDFRLPLGDALYLCGDEGVVAAYEVSGSNLCGAGAPSPLAIGEPFDVEAAARDPEWCTYADCVLAAVALEDGGALWAGEGSHGSEGFFARLGADRSLRWAVHLDDSNPFDAIERDGGVAAFRSTSGVALAVDVDDPRRRPPTSPGPHATGPFQR